MTDLRQSFVDRFGEADALRVEDAAVEHAKEANSKNRGDDEFRWAILICIGSECLTRFRAYHKIKAGQEAIHSWIVDNKQYLLKHKGDVDYLMLALGGYNFLLGDDDARAD